MLEIYGTARSLEGDFEEEVLKVLAKGRESNSNVKRVVRARQKTATKYRGDYTRLRDVLRGSIICGDVEDFSACAEGLKALGTAGVVDVVSVKNRLRRKDHGTDIITATPILTRTVHSTGQVGASGAALGRH